MGPLHLPRLGVFEVIVYCFNKLSASCDTVWLLIPQMAIVFGATSLFLSLTVSVIRDSKKALGKAGKE